MTPEQRQRAGQAVSARMSEQGRTAAWVQREAPVDNKTLQSLVEGRRWPNPATRGRIEAALGWPAGQIERFALGQEVAGERPMRPAEHLTNSQLIAELAMRLGEAQNQEKGQSDATATSEAGRAGRNVKELRPPTREDFEQGRAAAQKDPPSSGKSGKRRT